MNSNKSNTVITIDTIIKYIPSLGAIVYFFGFIIFNSHLSSYGIYEFKLLSFEYFKSGILFFALHSPIIGIIIYGIKNPTDNFGKDRGQMFNCFALSSFYSITVALFLFQTHIPFLILIVYFLLLFIGTSQLAKNWPRWLFLVLAISPIVSYLIYALINGYEAQLIFINGEIIFFVIALFLYIDYGDKKLNPYTISLYIFMVIVIASFFGIAVIKKIPFRFGGSESAKKSLLFTSDSKKILQFSPIRESLIESATRPLFIIYENENIYFIKLIDSSTVSLNKSLFYGEIILKR